MVGFQGDAIGRGWEVSRFLPRTDLKQRGPLDRPTDRYGGGMRVIDKRMFDAAGELREEVKRELENQAKAPPPPPAPPAPPVAAPVPDAPPAPAAGPPDPGFARLVVTLSNQAGLALGLLVDPLNPGRNVDLATARAIVDMLEALAVKTRGNLNEEEHQLLDSVLYELRMAYVERTKKPARA